MHCGEIVRLMVLGQDEQLTEQSIGLYGWQWRRAHRSLVLKYIVSVCAFAKYQLRSTYCRVLQHKQHVYRTLYNNRRGNHVAGITGAHQHHGCEQVRRRLGEFECWQVKNRLDGLEAFRIKLDTIDQPIARYVLGQHGVVNASLEAGYVAPYLGALGFDGVDLLQLKAFCEVP